MLRLYFQTRGLQKDYRWLPHPQEDLRSIWERFESAHSSESPEVIFINTSSGWKLYLSQFETGRYDSSNRPISLSLVIESDEPSQALPIGLVGKYLTEISQNAGGTENQNDVPQRQKKQRICFLKKLLEKIIPEDLVERLLKEDQLKSGSKSGFPSCKEVAESILREINESYAEETFGQTEFAENAFKSWYGSIKSDKAIQYFLSHIRNLLKTNREGCCLYLPLPDEETVKDISGKLGENCSCAFLVNETEATERDQIIEIKDKKKRKTGSSPRRNRGKDKGRKPSAWISVCILLLCVALILSWQIWQEVRLSQTKKDFSNQINEIQLHVVNCEERLNVLRHSVNGLENTCAQLSSKYQEMANELTALKTAINSDVQQDNVPVDNSGVMSGDPQSQSLSAPPLNIE